MPSNNYNDKYKEKKENFTKKKRKKKKFSEYFKHFRKKGVFVMLVMLSVYALFYRGPSGFSFYDKMTGRLDNTVTHASISKEQASEYTILVDAGHGGFDNGASSKYVDKSESQLNLEVSYKLKEALENIGFKVIMVRSDENALGDNKDADMAKRKSIIYESKADIMVSIHMNTHQDKSVNGPIVFFMPGSTKGNKLASLVQASMNNEVHPKNPKNVQSQNFLVLRSGNMPGVLVECGFISNKDEGSKLGTDSYQKKIAKSIALGIVDYFAESA